MTQQPTTNYKSSVGDPNYEYDSMTRIWKRARAILGGELHAKAHDRYIDVMNYTNLLVPFSARMSQEQYSWFVAEAELPGLTSQYAKIIAGGLLRKPPEFVMPDGVPKEAEDWLRNSFTKDGRSMIAFLDAAIWEELSTRGWVSIDYPVIPNYDSLTPEERGRVNPFPVLWKAEEVINWQTTYSPRTGKPELSRVIFRYIDYIPSESQYHPDLALIAVDHYLDENGIYTVQKYRMKSESLVNVLNGSLYVSDFTGSTLYTEGAWEQLDEATQPMMSGEKMTFLPIQPLNGELELEAPMLTPLIDREIALYNKVSRRNHLLYGAATFTPVVFSTMGEEDFASLVDSGLGTWVKLGVEDRIDAFKTPTESLVDMDRAIDAAVNEMSRMGIRMLAPEQAESGVALEIRNSSLTAQLGLLNTKLSSTMTTIIKLMLTWKYGPDVDLTGLYFNLSADFNPAPLGSEWARLATEWYQARLIPRSAWLSIIKQHDILPAEYNDETGIAEINQDSLIAPAAFDLATDEGSL